MQICGLIIDCLNNLSISKCAHIKIILSIYTIQIQKLPIDYLVNGNKINSNYRHWMNYSNTKINY